ncbi:puromycin-sensitive aminopeptidase-like isoform X3 [Bombyx mandarina]|uniref:Puromycin-sensitive aminopeptidase-like isoform X3 n=1 Tax=Bombyx mandarina TaxID=7092 RepID=A0A6J2K559_BOMMA|nr:puromycin-sensitive aminopeptidase-like isoform X3 [Bombyx mandarina]
MTLSSSRHQFLAFESQAPDDIQYKRRGGVFISHCICVAFFIFAILTAIIVGIIAHFVTFYTISNKSTEYWNEAEPFGVSDKPSPDLRLPTSVTPSFYRLKIKADLDKANFSGDVHITLKANRRVKEIILHSKALVINSSKLTEQIYERVETIHTKVKRDVQNESISDTTTPDNSTTNLPPTTESPSQIINETTAPIITAPIITTPMITTPITTTANPISVDTQITHSSVRSVQIIGTSVGTGDRLLLTLGSALTPGVDYTLQLSFSGNITNTLTGFYKSTYVDSNNENRYLGVTQFEPTSARSVFPCFDEPAFKAKFEISIAHPQNLTVLSNMKVATQEPITETPKWQWTHFERSVDMSTYLVAFVLSDFTSLETSYVSMDNVTKPIRIWARPELISKANYALRITPKLLNYYEDVFGVPYVLDKLDMIAIPEFSSGAMENWGLITFREMSLLYDEAEGIPRDKQNVAVSVAHELAHQWFGNLVTMRWWTDLWLNEGFASYIEYLGVDHIEPEWNMFESFSRDKMDLLRSDALKNTSPVSKKVVDASEISQKFDEISYTKGSNLIRMLNHTISEQLFHKGLVIYLNDWKFSNAEENDLWAAMSRAVSSERALDGESVVRLMNSWTRQAGYPVVTANRNYDTGAVEIEQRLFTSAKDPYQSMVDQLWHIPISYVNVDAPLDEWSTKPKTWLKDRISVFNVPYNSTQALYLNVDAIGYYRVNYDQRNWQLLAAALREGRLRSAIAAAQLVDDAFNLARAAQLDYAHALQLAACAAARPGRVLWDQLLNNMAALKYNLMTTAGYTYFQDFIRILLKNQLERLNYGLDKPKDDNEAFLIENLLMWECYAESPRCLRWARAQFDAWYAQNDHTAIPIPSHLRSLVLNMALRHGGRQEFDFLFEVFRNTSDPSLKALIINNLPSTREENLIVLLLEKSLSELPKQYAAAAWGVEPGAGSRVAQEYFYQHFERIHARFADMDSFIMPTVLNGAFGFITTDDELARLKAFAVKHRERLLPVSQTLQKLVDTAALRIHWIRKYSAGIARWLRDYTQGTLTTTEGGAVNASTTEAPANTTMDISTAPPSTPSAASNTTT